MYDHRTVVERFSTRCAITQFQEEGIWGGEEQRGRLGRRPPKPVENAEQAAPVVAPALAQVSLANNDADVAGPAEQIDDRYDKDRILLSELSRAHVNSKRYLAARAGIRREHGRSIKKGG